VASDRSGHPIRWALLGAAAVLVAALGVRLLGGLGTTTAAERTPEDAASLASDAAEPRPTPEAAVRPGAPTAGAAARDAATAAGPVDTEGVRDTEAGDRKSKRKRNRAGRELKPNPYKK
jgi:hypothetical protein